MTKPAAENDKRDMRQQLIASAKRDPEGFASRVITNFSSLSQTIRQQREEIEQKDASISKQAALITELSLQREAAQAESERTISSAKKAAADIVADARRRADAMLQQAKENGEQTELEARSIAATHLQALRGDVNGLQEERRAEQASTSDFLRTMSSEYDGIIAQCADQLSQLRAAKSRIDQKAAEVASRDYTNFAVEEYIASLTGRPADEDEEQHPAPEPEPEPEPEASDAYGDAYDEPYDNGRQPAFVPVDDQPQQPGRSFMESFALGGDNDDGAGLDALDSLTDMAADGIDPTQDWGDGTAYHDATKAQYAYDDDGGAQEQYEDEQGAYSSIDQPDLNDSGLLFEQLGAMLDDDLAAENAGAQQGDDNLEDLDDFEGFDAIDPGRQAYQQQPQTVQSRITLPRRRHGNSSQRDSGMGWR